MEGTNDSDFIKQTEMIIWLPKGRQKGNETSYEEITCDTARDDACITCIGCGEKLSRYRWIAL